MTASNMSTPDSSRDPRGFRRVLHRHRLLVSGGVALLIGLGVLAATKNFVLAVACATPMGVTLGIVSTEQARPGHDDPKQKTWIALALLLGVAVLVALLVF